MNATKNQYQMINGVMTPTPPYGSIPAVEWTDANGNTFRAFPTDLLFYNSEEVYIVKIKKEIKPNGMADWITFSEYPMIADATKWRSLQTGTLVTADVALDGNGNLNPGYVTNGKFFSIMLGYNPGGINQLGVFEWIYIEIADYESVTIV